MGNPAIHDKKIAPFVVLTYLLSYALVPLYFALGGTKAMPGSLILGDAGINFDKGGVP